MKISIFILLLILVPNYSIYSIDKKEVIDTLEESIAFLDEEINLPDDSFFGKDKDDVKEEIDDFLDELNSELMFPSIFSVDRIHS